jgi:hypothetical protein
MPDESLCSVGYNLPPGIYEKGFPNEIMSFSHCRNISPGPRAIPKSVTSKELDLCP